MFNRSNLFSTGTFSSVFLSRINRKTPRIMYAYKPGALSCFGRLKIWIP